MTRLIEYPLSDGSTVLFEVSDNHIRDEIMVGKRTDEVVAKANKTLNEALDSIKPTMAAVVEKVRDLQPAELEVEVGVAITAEAGVVISKFGGEANIKVKATWK